MLVCSGRNVCEQGLRSWGFFDGSTYKKAGAAVLRTKTNSVLQSFHRQMKTRSNTAATTHQNLLSVGQESRLLSLPPELRNIIYQYALIKDYPIALAEDISLMNPSILRAYYKDLSSVGLSPGRCHFHVQ